MHAQHPEVYYRQKKKTTYLKIKGAQKHKVGLVGTECGSERRWGRGEKYDQKTLYEILKYFFKTTETLECRNKFYMQKTTPTLPERHRIHHIGKTKLINS